MATVTNAKVTATTVGLREDLTNQIHRVDVEDTPFTSRIGATPAKAVNHEWQTRALVSPGQNAKPEGNTTSRAAGTNNVRVGNLCQILEENATVSGTIEKVDKAGRDKEMAEQMADKTIKLRQDIELACIGNQAYDANATVGGETGVRTMRGFESWLRTNTSRGVGGADPADPNVTPGTAPTDGTQRAFTETLLLDTLQEIFTAGGSTKYAFMGPYNKRIASSFTGRASAREQISPRTIHQATTMYASDFGDIQFIPHRYMRSSGRSVLLVDPKNVKVAYLRKFERFPLAKIGDAETRVILSECTLEVCNEKAHGIIADLTTAAA